MHKLDHTLHARSNKSPNLREQSQQECKKLARWRAETSQSFSSQNNWKYFLEVRRISQSFLDTVALQQAP